MRFLTMIVFALGAAACGASSASSREPVGNQDPAADPPPADGPGVIELAPVTSAVAGGDALDGAIRDAARGAIVADGTYATDGNAAAYRLDTKVEALDVTGTGVLTVACKLAVTISTLPDHAIFGMANANATVESDQAGLELAKRDCVAAVMDNIVAKQIIPTLQKR
jgi:hypothetical protein